MGLKPIKMIIAKITLSDNSARNIIRRLLSEIELEPIDVIKELNLDVTPEDPLSSEQRRCLKLYEEFTTMIKGLSVIITSPPKGAIDFEKDNLYEVNDIAINILRDAMPLIDINKKILLLEREITELTRLIKIFDNLNQLGISDIRKDLGSGNYFYATLGFLPIDNVYRLKWNLGQLTGDNYIYQSIIEGKNEIALIGVQKEYEATLERLVESFGFSKVTVPDNIPGTPEEAKTTIQNLINEKNEEKMRLLSKIKPVLQEKTLDIYAMYEQLKIEKERIDLLTKGRKISNKFKLWVWVPANQKKKVKKIINEFNDSELKIEFVKPELKTEEFPTKLSNNPYSRPFEDLVHGFGTPGYKELDPTKILSILIPIFFGIMFADFIDGFVVLLLGLYGLWLKEEKYSKNSMLAELQFYLDKGGTILCYLGISAMFFGLMFGSYRGLAGIHAIEAGLPILWFSPEIEGGQFALLELSILLGSISIAVALILQFISTWNHNKTEAIFLPGMFFIFYIGLIFLLFTFGPDPLSWLSKTTGTFDFKALQHIAQYQEEIVVEHHEGTSFNSLVGNIFATTGIVHWGIPVFAIGPLSYPMMFLLVSLILTTGYHFKLGMDGVSEWLDYLITMISNTISFARIFAYTMVHGSLSLVFIQLFEMMTPGNPLLGMFFGAFIVIPLELLVSFLQSLRLNWVEFFGKMHFVGSGRKFNPIKIQRYYTISK